MFIHHNHRPWRRRIQQQTHFVRDRSPNPWEKVGKGEAQKEGEKCPYNEARDCWGRKNKECFESNGLRDEQVPSGSITNGTLTNKQKKDAGLRGLLPIFVLQMGICELQVQENSSLIIKQVNREVALKEIASRVLSGCCSKAS